MTALELTLILLSAAVLGVVAFRMLQLPPILGYLTVGILIGPFSFGLAQNTQTTHLLAEFGVVFLMFSIGLEFSFGELMSMRRKVFGLGSAQVLLTIGTTVLLTYLVEWISPWSIEPWKVGIALGSVFAMSSTAIVVKMLTERMELDSAHGRPAISILLFQDLTLVPLMVLLPALSKDPAHIMLELGRGIGKTLLVLALLSVAGHFLMRRWLHMVAKRGSQELFTLNLLLITLGAGWITHSAGLSMALGAFVAGLLISETPFKHQVEEDIKSFRDVLLGLFFITVGMSLNIHIAWENSGIILLIALALIGFKFVLIAALCKLFRLSTGAALRCGLVLAQAGEFGFVLLQQTADSHLINAQVSQVILAVMVISMLIAPFLILKADQIVLKLSANEWMLQSVTLTQIAARNMAVEHHVIIAGFGRTGQNLARLLEEENIAYHALDLDPERVRIAQIAGANLSYGDATRRATLIAAGIQRAAALVVTYQNTSTAIKLLHYVHELRPDLPVIVRSHDDKDLEKLLAAGASEVVPEIIEASMMLASHALVIVGVPLRRVLRRLQEARNARYVSFRGYFHGEGDDSDDAAPIKLQTVILGQNAYGVNKILGDLKLADQSVEVVSIRRGKKRLEFSAETILQSDDVLVLRGLAEGIMYAQSRLLKS